MNTLAPMALMLAHLAEMTDDQFRAFVDGLRQELGPTGFMEKFLVERITLCINRMRRSAKVEAEGEPPNAAWLRYEAAAERAFWKAYNELMKNRRQQAREAEAAARVATAPAQPVAPPRPATAPDPAPAAPRPQIARPEPSRPLPRREPAPALAPATGLDEALAGLRERLAATAVATARPTPARSAGS